MPFDPEDVLGAINQTDPGKGTKKSSSGFDPSDVKAAVGPSLGKNLISGTIDPNTQFSDFRFQPKTNADNYLLRAQDQGFWESLGKTIGNVAANIPLDIVQGVGYLGTMLEFGDDRDYTNALVEGIEKLKNPLGEVYQEHPNETIDMSDSAWWMNNLGGLVESAASFAVEGAGIAKLFGTLAKGAAWSAKAGKLASKAAQGLSAATLTYMEGAMSGANVFETAYNNNYMKMIGQGVDASEADQQAKHIASQAAAATVQLHTAMNLALNMTALTPLFRDPDQAIVRWWRKNGAAAPGETSEQWMARIAQSAPDGMPLKKLLGLGMQGPSRLGLESIQEGLEEVNTQYAERVGASIGEGKEQKDVAGRLTDADRYFSEVLNEEGALNMALGSLGGIAQTAILDHIPVHKVVKYGADGKPLMSEGTVQTERVSSHTMNERMNRQYFDNIKDALSKDMQWLSAKNKEMENALKNKDLATLARARADLLSVHNLRAISLGLGDAWKQQYEDIANLDNTKSLSEDLNPAIQELDRQIEEDRGAGDQEALNQKSAQRYELLKQQAALQDTTEATQKGFAQSKTDNSYKERALQAIQTLDSLTKLYQDMQDKFTGTPELDQSGLAEHMFYRQANLQLHKQQLDLMEQDLLKLRSRIDEMTLSSQDDILVRQAQEFLADKEVWDSTVKKLNNDIARINEAVKTKNDGVIVKLLDKYKIPVVGGAGKALIEKLERRKNELQTRADTTYKEFHDTIALWKENNPGKEAKDIIQKASERPALEEIYRQNKAYLQQGLTEHEIAKEQLAKDSTREGIQRFLKESKPVHDKKQLNKEHIEAYGQQMDREIAATLDAKQKQAQVTQLDSEIAKFESSIAAKNAEIQTLERKNSTLKGFKNILSRKTNRDTIRDIEAEISEIKFGLVQLKNRRQALVATAAQATQQAQNVDRTPAPVVQPVTTTPAAQETAPVVEEEELQYNETLPDFDFGQEVIPAFTNIQEGHQIFDKLVGGSEAGNTLRQFIQLRKTSEVEFLVNATSTMIQRTNLPMPTEQEITEFVTPYITALKESYLAQKPNAEQEYESLKGFLKPDVLTILDILEGEFRQHGFSYDRTIQVLNQQVKAKNLEQNLVGPIANQLKAYLEFKQDTIIPATPVREIQQPTIQTTDYVLNNLPKIEDKTLSDLMTKALSEKATEEDIRVVREYIKANFSTDNTLLYVGLGNRDFTPSNYRRLIEAPKFGDRNVTEILLEGDQASHVGSGQSSRFIGFTSENKRSIGSDFFGESVKVYSVDTSNIPNLTLFLAKAKTVSQITGKSKVEDTIAPVQPTSLFDEMKESFDTSDTSKDFNEDPNTFIPPTTDSEPTIFSNAALDLEVVNQESKVFVGASNVEAVKANFNTHPYREFDNGSEIRIVSDYTQLDPNLNTDVLIPGVINPGDQVIFEVDENWSGEINYDTEMIQDEYGEQLRRADMFQNYLENPDRIGTVSSATHPKGAHANVPIKIVHQSTGKVIGYLPRADWIIARYPDTGNYRNVVDEYRDEDTEVTDNVARQYSRIMKLREAVVRSWNTDKSLKLDSTISKRGTGHVMINREVNPNTGKQKLVKRSAKNMLPDNSLEIAIIKQGSVYVAAGIQTQKPVTQRLPAYMKDATSLPVALLPSPDGTFVPTPLYTHKLGDNPSLLNTVISAIGIYLRNSAEVQTIDDVKAIAKIQEGTGFDIRIPMGLRNFIQQYFTYTQKFGEKDTVITPSEASSARPEFMLDIPDLQPGEKTSFIKVGTSFSGEKPLYAQLVNTDLHPDFEDALREGLKNRFKSVIFPGRELRGINSEGEFKAPIIRADGVVQFSNYENYNEFVKASSTTFAYGLNKVGDQYVYMANPVIQLDYEKALKTALPVIDTTLSESVQKQVEEEGENIEPDELADLFGNGILSPSPSSIQPLSTPSQGEQVSLELLQELRNLTPEAHRNTLSPEQVLRELLERGVTVLAEGHNPFYIC